MLEATPRPPPPVPAPQVAALFTDKALYGKAIGCFYLVFVELEGALRKAMDADKRGFLFELFYNFLRLPSVCCLKGLRGAAVLFLMHSYPLRCCRLLWLCGRLLGTCRRSGRAAGKPDGAMLLPPVCRLSQGRAHCWGGLTLLLPPA